MTASVRRTVGAVAAGLVLGLTVPCAAEPTRAEVIAAERAARAKQLSAYEPGRLESAFLWAQRTRVAERFSGNHDGFYPVFGSLTRGGGMAFGGGWRRHLAGERVLVNTSGAMTARGYRSGRIEVRLPRLARERLEIGVRARHRYYPQEDYYGLGPRSGKADRVSYLFSETELSAFGLYTPRRWFRAGGQVAHLSPSIRSGTDGRYPSIEERFDDSSAPGLTGQPNFLETGGVVEADFRDQPNNPRSGGRFSLLVVGYDDRSGTRHDFTRVTAVAEQHLPIFDRKRVFSVRVVTTRLGPREGSVVPFYYMPAFGGRDTVRGFVDYRFRDNAWALVNAEYRWEAVSGVEMALFYDVGDVASRWQALSLAGARQSYGFGVRFNTAKSVFMRAEVAFGSGEGTRAYVAFGPPLRVERYLR